MGELRIRMIKFRAKHRLTQKELAERVGISLPTLVSAENERDISELTRQKILIYLDEQEENDARIRNQQ